MRNDLAQKVDFTIIRYANCWEDAEVLLEGLSPVENSKILSIGSAGDNSFSLLTTNPELIVAVDINKTQLHLIELKKACIKKLAREEALMFLGFMPSLKRIDVFNQLKTELTNDARKYWEASLNVIDRGVIYAGKFEKYFLFFSKNILPLIHSKKLLQNYTWQNPKRSKRFFMRNNGTPGDGNYYSRFFSASILLENSGATLSF